MSSVSAPVRRYLIMLRNSSNSVGELPASTWVLVETTKSESDARARYFAMRSFLEEHDAACLVVESVKPVLGPEEQRVLINRSAVLEKGRIPDPTRLSREQAVSLAQKIDECRERELAAVGGLHARPRHAAAWASALGGFVLTMVGVTGYTLWLRAPEQPTALAAADVASPGGSLIVVPEGNSLDRFVMFRLQPDGTRTDERRISKAEYEALQAKGGRSFRDKEPSAASRTSSLAERTSMFARFRSDD